MARVRGPSSLALLALAASFTLAACSSASGPTGPGELDGLALSAGTLNPAFNSSITSYVATVPFGTLGVSVTPTASTAHASAIAVLQDSGSPATVASGSPSAALSVPAHGSQSVVQIAVTPPGGGTPVVYTVTLVQADDGDATLGGLVLSAGTLSPAFSSGVTSYSVTLPSGTSGFTVTPSATMADVKSITVSQDGGAAATVANGKQSAALKVPAAGAQSTIAITLTAQNGYTTQSYTLTVTLAGNSDASLASLTPSAGTLTPSFASGTRTYALGVPVGTPSVTLTPKANNSTVRAIVITQDGGAPAVIANNTVSAALLVPAIGSTSNISIRVTAQDGSSTVTYSVALKQNASNDASLASLTISAGALSPAFASGSFTYADTVPFGTSTVTITPTATGVVHSIAISQDAGQATTIGSGTTSPALTVPAPGTQSTVTVVVTAQDGTTQATYTIALSQASGANSALSNLTVSAGSLSPAFTAASLSYDVVVPHGTSTVTVTPTVSGTVHSITVALNGGAPQTVASGSASTALAVPAVGSSSTITVAVQSQDQAHTTTYSIALSQASSTTSTLSALALSAGTLTPAFSRGVLAYAVTVPNATTTFTVTATADDPSTESITVSQDGSSPATITSGASSNPLPAPNVGTPSLVTVTATAQDGSNTAYVVTVNRAASSDAALSALAVSAGSLSPQFAASAHSYALAVPFGTSSVTVTPTAESSAARSITVAQDAQAPVTVASGSASQALTVPAVAATSTITVVVTAQDGVTVGSYTITLSQVAPDTDSSLSALSASPFALSPAFLTTTTSYTLTVPFGTTGFALTPTASATDIQSIKVSQDGGAAQVVASGSPSQTLTVPAVGTTSSVAIVVTAQDGSKTTYTVVVSQAGRNDSSLASLVDSAGALTGFDPGVTAYSYAVPFQATYSITAATNDSQASFKVNGTAGTNGVAVPIALVPGVNHVVVAVTSADGTSTTDYTLTITEGTAPTIAVSVGGNPVLPSATVDFGSHATTIASNAITFTVSNGGSSALSFSAAVTAGGSDFVITTAPVSPVGGSGTTTFVVTFTPSALGSRSGTLTLTNLSASQAPYVIHLTGTGLDPVTAITVSAAGGNTLINEVGTTLQLTAAVAPADAEQTVAWSSSAPNVATVDSNGLVTAANFGTTVINATATDGSGVKGTISIGVTGANNVVGFVKQTPTISSATMSAALSGGTFSVLNTYGTTGNAFKVSGNNYYGNVANGFVTLQAPVSGDFTINATVTLTATPKPTSACGLGVGLTTGFSGTDKYAYVVLNQAFTEKYVSGNLIVTSATSPTESIALNTPVQVTFSRIGSNLIYGFGTTTVTTPVSTFTDGTNNFGAGPVYPGLSFNNVTATVSNMVITDGHGTVLFDPSTGTMAIAALGLSSSTVSVNKSSTVNVTATAISSTGSVATVTAVPTDSSIVSATVTNNANNSTIALTGQKAGTTTVTVTNGGDSNNLTNTKTITVTVNDFSSADNYGPIAGRVYPAPAATGAYTDGELALTFDSPPTLNPGGSISIYNSDGTLADTIAFANEVQTIANVPVNVGSQLVRVSNNTLFFTPHFGKVAYGKSYYVAISTLAITGTLNTVPFVGFSNLSTVATWSFSTRAAPTLASPVTVDGSQSSTANFRTLGGALMSLAATPISGATAVAVNVASGTYIELVNYRAATPNSGLTITISGRTGNNRGDDTVIQYTNGGNMNGTQTSRASFYFAGANLVLQNLTLQNTGTKATVAQAEAMYFDSRAGFTMAANNCSFKSMQDTIQTSGRTWIYNSFIEGDTDFIWGTADASLFENCSLHVVADPALNNPYSIFVARTGTTGAATIGKGYVLLNSTVSVDSGMVASYGRDAGTGAFYDQVALINNVFSGAGTLTTGLWDTRTQPIILVDPTFVGWKASGNTGLSADTIQTATNTASSINSQSTEYDNRDHILNRVVTITAGAPSGFQTVANPWDTSGLASQWGAP
jgi:hypothetical protein